jgi:hypothetical protein
LSRLGTGLGATNLHEKEKSGAAQGASVFLRHCLKKSISPDKRVNWNVDSNIQIARERSCLE